MELNVEDVEVDVMTGEGNMVMNESGESEDVAIDETAVGASDRC